MFEAYLTVNLSNVASGSVTQHTGSGMGHLFHLSTISFLCLVKGPLGLTSGIFVAICCCNLEGVRAGELEGVRVGELEGIRAGELEGVKAGELEGVRAGELEGRKTGGPKEEHELDQLDPLANMYYRCVLQESFGLW